jgi:hypothetical protein
VKQLIKLEADLSRRNEDSGNNGATMMLRITGI